MSEIVTEATMLDNTHLALLRPLPEHWGRRLLVRIAPMPEESEHLLGELRAAYLTMSERERQAEMAMAEEGLWAQDLTEAFPEEIEWPWWE
jgi:hypothetical protein